MRDRLRHARLGILRILATALSALALLLASAPPGLADDGFEPGVDVGLDLVRLEGLFDVTIEPGIGGLRTTQQGSFYCESRSQYNVRWQSGGGPGSVGISAMADCNPSLEEMHVSATLYWDTVPMIRAFDDCSPPDDPCHHLFDTDAHGCHPCGGNRFMYTVTEIYDPRVTWRATDKCQIYDNGHRVICRSTTANRYVPD